MKLLYVRQPARLLAIIRLAVTKLLVALGVFTLALSPSAALPNVARSVKHPAPANKEIELKEVRERIAAVSKSIQADAERRESLVGELKEADEGVQSARLALTEVHARRIAAEQQRAALEGEQHSTEQRINAERAELSSELRLAYMNGRGEQLKLLLNQQDPARLGRMLGYYGYFSRSRAELIGMINDQLAHLAMLTERISEHANKLRKIETDDQKSVSALANARIRRADTLRHVESNIKNGSQRLAKLQADATSLERLIDELRAAEQARHLASSTTAPSGRGHWPWPVKGDLLARFGQLRAGGPLKWDGLIIAAPTGAQVHAPAAGRVLYSDWLPGLGLLLVLDHGGGIMSLYGHNEQLFKQQGDQVRAGELLAAVGDSGLEGRSGLYLEIRNGKHPIDPLNWLGKP